MNPIQIGSDILVTVVRANEGKVRIGVDAPDELSVTRPDAATKELPARRLTLLQYIAATRRQLRLVQSCLESLDEGNATIDQCVQAIRRAVNETAH